MYSILQILANALKYHRVRNPNFIQGNAINQPVKIVKSPTSRGQNPNYIQSDPTLPRRHPPTFPDILVFVFVFVHVFVIVFVSSMS